MIFTSLIFSLSIMGVPADNYDITGTYFLTRKGRPNSSRWSTTTLKVNCDSTVSVYLRTHGGLTTWEGSWTTQDDTLTINLKPILTKDGKKYLGSWENIDRFLIRKNKLILFVTRLNGEKIEDPDSLDDFNRALKKDEYKKINKKNCS